MTQPFVTILVPMRNEEEFIAACLESLQRQHYQADRMEILVLDGESTDRSAEIVQTVSADDPRVRLLPNPRRLQAAGMNLGIREAHGEIVIRADAHAVYGPAYVAICVEHLAAGRAENVGGLQRPVGAGPFGRAVAAALQTPLGAGNAPYRLARELRYADTVWLGAWRTETLRELGGFRDDMAANEDYELNCRLRERGGRILLDPSLPGTYYPRTSPRRLWRQYFHYGTGKIQCLRAHPNSLVLRQLLVPLVVAALLISLLLLPLTPFPALVSGGLYLLLLLLGSLAAAVKFGWRHLPLLPVIYPIIHVAWGAGFWWGIIRYGGFPLRPRGLLQSERLVQTGKAPEEIER
jgi:glycosyltransferase involved in cell wall biosynthesis